MSDTPEKSIKQLCIYLLKSGRATYMEYIKGKYEVESASIKSEFALDGEIFYPSTHSAPPRWKQDIQDLAATSISVDDNCSNKAILLTRLDGATLAVTFGYGRSLLKEEDIERNFGLKVALSIIDSKKIRSVNTATFEDMVVSSQRQASSQTTQEEFEIDTIGNIFRGVTGVPANEQFGNTVSGKDMLKVSVFMHITELKEKLQSYIAAYRSENYRTNDFEWIDNINEVRDAVLAEELDSCLLEKLDEHLTDDITISPPETIDWDNTMGIFIKGAGRELAEPTNTIDINAYLARSRSINIAKLKRDKLMVCNIDGSDYAATSIYSALVTHVLFDDKRYVLCMGCWYLIQSDFYSKVSSFVDTIPRCDGILPSCTSQVEGEYNESTASNDPNLCLLDKLLFRVEDAPTSIEACDLFSKDKKFIHVKFKTRSSLLSHLFAQGRVSYQSFIADEHYRKAVVEKINELFGEEILHTDDTAEGYEIIYGIITKKDGRLSDIIPFFSAVTLMQTAKALTTLRARCSVCIIQQE
jgi:uncharacterized protein (TIGR04141 family)